MNDQLRNRVAELNAQADLSRMRLQMLRDGRMQLRCLKTARIDNTYAVKRELSRLAEVERQLLQVHDEPVSDDDNAPSVPLR